MKLLTKLLVVGVLAFVGGFAATSILSTTVYSHDGEDHSEEVAQTDGEQQEEGEQDTSQTYTFTAQPGDSYSLIARKTIQIYGIENEVSLSDAQIIAAETWLTQDAGSPSLNVGQEVTLENSDVQSAVEQAEGLDEAALALWASYAANANFDTNSVGESS